MVELMVSATMAIQDQNGSTTNSSLPVGNGTSLGAALHSVASVQLQDQFSCGNDYALKVRKPYTITKQRERWTEEEHKKFLEALRLYGRAWRRIEEHVGTKTAVQIRSHAQKFFSKVVRESSGSNTSSAEPIEIPPPRPKRKPMHPYPRKLAQQLNKEPLNLEQPKRSTSPNSFVSDQENQSPTSVLSAVGSDTFGSTYSSTPNCSSSPVSSAADVHPGVFVLSEANPSPEENRSPSPAPVTADLASDDHPSMRFDLFPKVNSFAKEGSAEESPQPTTRSVKLFGRTVLVTDSHRPSPPSLGTCKLQPPSDANEEKPLQTLQRNFTVTESSSRNMEYTWGQLPHGAPGSLYFMQFQNENSNQIEAGCASPMPWWTLYGGVPFPFLPFHATESVKTDPNSIVGVQDKETPREGSWTGSNTGSVDNGDKNSDMETQSPQVSFGKEERESKPVFQFKLSDKSTFSGVIPEKCMQGFVPYKRCLAERDRYSSTITSEEREEQSIRLSL